MSTEPRSPNREEHINECTCGMIRPGVKPNYWYRDAGNHSTGCRYPALRSRDSLAFIEAHAKWERQAKADMGTSVGRDSLRSQVALDYIKRSGLLDRYGDLSRMAQYLWDLAHEEAHEPV